MSKIISDGYLQKFTGRCPNCGCVFEYDDSDVFSDDTMLCPKCWACYEVRYF